MVSHLLSLIIFLLKTDLFTGALSYENKFSLDAKPISGGVRLLSLSLAFIRGDVSSDLERDSFLCVRIIGDERSKNRKIFAPVPLGLKSPDEEKLTKRANIFSRAHSFSLFQPVINTHTHTHTHTQI